MTRRHRLLANASSLLVLQAANYLLPLLILPYLVRTLGTENYGLMAFAQAFAIYFVVLVDYGFNLSATRRIAIHREDRGRVSEIYSAAMTARALLLLAGALLFVLIVAAVPRFRLEWSLFLAAFVMVIGHAAFPPWLFQGMERMKYITIANVGSKAAAVVAIFLLVREPTDYVLATALQSAGFVLAGLIGLAAARFAIGVRFQLPSRQALRTTFVEGWQVFVSQVSVSLFGNTNVFILGLFASPTVVGQFAIAEKIIRAVIGLSVPVSGAIYPMVSALFHQSQEAALAFLRRVARIGGLVFLGVSGALLVGADLAVLLVTGEPNPSISLLVRVMAFLPLTVFIDNLYGVQILLNLGMERQFTRAIVSAGLFSLAAALLVVPALQALGSALVFALTGVVVLTLLALPVHRAGIRLHSAR
jgi:polysaccharide transporter, PST family